jgi:hypothetical protein
MSDQEMAKCACKCYRPGDAGFDEIASQVVPLSRIRTNTWSGDLRPYSEFQDARIFRRNESND